MKALALRTQLTLSYAAALAVLLGALGLACYHAFARQLDHDATRELTEITRGLHGYLRFDNAMPQLSYARQDPYQATFVQDATRYYQVYDGRTGRLLTQSPALQPLGLHYTPNEVRRFTAQPVITDVHTDRRRLRFSNSVISPASGETYLVQVGVPLDGRDAALHSLLTMLLWSLPAALAVVLLAGRWMAGRALAPLAEMASAASAIGVANLDRRLQVRGTGDELDAVAIAFNGVVARLERVIDDMRQFSAAMAHEIRTPLAAMRADMELSLSTKRSPEQQQKAAVGQIEEVDKLTRLLSQLLTLARAEAGELRVVREPFTLADLCAAVVEVLEPVAEARNVSLSCRCRDDVDVTGDRGWIERLLVNLIDNALKFTPAGGRVEVLVDHADEIAVLTVRDSGIGIPKDALPHVFERFYRADSSRTPEVDGAGLGLALVKWIAERHQGSVDIVSDEGHGTVVTVRLPALRVPLAARAS
jgi:heavy metal sensor kinase